MSIEFCHISPVKTLFCVREYKTHLLLAHLVEENEEYRNFYIDLKKKNPSVFYHLDNSAFEMFKRGVPMYDSNKLIEMGKLVGADSIVMSDYPKENWEKTVESAIELIPELKDAGFKTFFCPQSELGDIEGLIDSFDWAISNKDIDYIGVSILNCPIGLGINETTFDSGTRNESYRMQRFLSRWRIFNILKEENLLVGNVYKRFHCLGMMDGPREIDILREFHPYIFSWDSSSAIWHGLHNINYDESPTGLMNGKFEKEVDFEIDPDFSDGQSALCVGFNMGLIDRLCGMEVEYDNV